MAYKNVEKFLEDPQWNAKRGPETYFFEKESDEDEDIRENYLQLPAIERYIKYRADVKSSCSSPDPDGSSWRTRKQTTLIYDVYEKLWGWEHSDNFNYLKQKALFSCRFGSDTMHSTQTILNIIITEMAEKYPEYQFKDSPRARASVKKLIDLHAKHGSKYTECLRAAYPILEDYVVQYHTIGNFVLVPAYFNQYRGGFNLSIDGFTTQDYWDLSLQYLRKNGFPEAKSKKNEKDVFDKSDFPRYINYFFLWDHVNPEGKPISLFDETVAVSEEKSRTDCNAFMENVIFYIRRRGIFMVAMLKLQALIGEEDYAKLREEIFAEKDKIYADYTEVLEALREYLNTMTLESGVCKEATGILADAEGNIERVKMLNLF